MIPYSENLYLFIEFRNPISRVYIHEANTVSNQKSFYFISIEPNELENHQWALQRRKYFPKGVKYYMLRITPFGKYLWNLLSKELIQAFAESNVCPKF